ncbi:hypothetical protein P353_08090 [Comamonas testosteroni]|uniref:Uncharacterized protein n=1 Tax=Comamonas testosteroni TaxID=285 RepID=A0A096H026_COMTE|nr:hypothetical protein P353_08090 [Comamonas testosteroni]
MTFTEDHADGLAPHQRSQGGGVSDIDDGINAPVLLTLTASDFVRALLLKFKHDTEAVGFNNKLMSRLKARVEKSLALKPKTRRSIALTEFASCDCVHAHGEILETMQSVFHSPEKCKRYLFANAEAGSARQKQIEEAISFTQLSLDALWVHSMNRAVFSLLYFIQKSIHIEQSRLTVFR